MSKKEIWPGAGLELDFDSLTEAEFNRVKDHVSRLPDANAKLVFLRKLIVVLESRIPELKIPIVAQGIARRGRSLVERPSREREFYDGCRRLRNEIEGLAKIDAQMAQAEGTQHKVKREQQSKTEEEKPETAPQDVTQSKSGTVSQRVWAVSYLLEALGVDYEVRGKKAAVTDLFS